MSSVLEFAQFALQERVAPPSLGNVNRRLRHATIQLLQRNAVRKRLQLPQLWTPNRVKDIWYADPRISIKADEVRDIEEISGLRYGRQELTDLDALITRADTLLDGADTNFRSQITHALRALLSALDRPGAE